MSDAGSGRSRRNVVNTSAVKKRCRCCFQPHDESSLRDHPMGLEIGLPRRCMCQPCLRIYSAGRWDWKLDAAGKDEFCRICGEGNLGTVSCDKEGCTYSFCEGCVLANCGQTNYDRILDLAEKSQWHCFACAIIALTSAAMVTPSYASPVQLPANSPNRIRTFLHLTARAAAGGFTKRTIFDPYTLQRSVPGLTYFNRTHRRALRAARRGLPPTVPRSAFGQIVDLGLESVTPHETDARTDAPPPHDEVSSEDGGDEGEVDEDEDEPRNVGYSKLHGIDVWDGDALGSRAAARLRAASAAAAAISTSSITACSASLATVAASASPATAAAAPASAPSSEDRPWRKIISFSFFLHELHTASHHTPYVYGLLENIRRIHRDWPGWTARIYYDDSFQVPAPSETLGAHAPVDGIVCKVGYHIRMRRVWYTLLFPLLAQLERRGLVELRRFNWPHLQDKDRIHHGNIGCFARFLALADLGARERVEQVVVADVDNHLTLAARTLIERTTAAHHRFHDPRYPVPVWAGGFAARIPRDADRSTWLNPYASIESDLMSWCATHCRDPLDILSRSEMPRAPSGGHHQDPSEQPNAKGDSERRKIDRARADEEESRRRDRAARVGGGARDNLFSAGPEPAAAAAATAEKRPERRQPRRATRSDSNASSSSTPVSTQSPAPVPVSLAECKEQKENRSREEEHKSLARPVRSSGGPVAPVAIAPLTRYSLLTRHDEHEHKEARNPHNASSPPADNVARLEDGPGESDISSLSLSLPSRSNSYTPSVTTSTPPSSQSSQPEKRRSSRAHASTIAIECEQGTRTTTTTMTAVATSTATAATTPIVLDVEEEDDDDDECVEIAPPPKKTPPTVATPRNIAPPPTPTIAAEESKKPVRSKRIQSRREATTDDDPESSDAVADLHVDSDDAMLEFFPYGSDQVFLADVVWPTLRLDCDTTWSLLPTSHLARTQKVWPPILTPSERAQCETAVTYWSLMDWMPNSARPKPDRIEPFVKRFIVTQWATMLHELKVTPFSPHSTHVTYAPVEEVRAKIESGAITVPVPLGPHCASLERVSKRKHSSSSSRSGGGHTVATDEEETTIATTAYSTKRVRRPTPLKQEVVPPPPPPPPPPSVRSSAKRKLNMGPDSEKAHRPPPPPPSKRVATASRARTGAATATATAAAAATPDPFEDLFDESPFDMDAPTGICSYDETDDVDAPHKDALAHEDAETIANEHQHQHLDESDKKRVKRAAAHSVSIKVEEIDTPAAAATPVKTASRPSRKSLPDTSQMPPSFVACQAHFLDECEWGCLCLHDARGCQTDGAEVAACANHEQMMSSDDGHALRDATAAAVTSATTETKTEEAPPQSSVEVGNISAGAGVESASHTPEPLAPAAAEVTATDPATIHVDADHDVDDDDGEDDESDDGYDPVPSLVSGRESRLKKARRPYGEFVPSAPVVVKKALPLVTPAAPKMRVPCTCACDFCAPPFFSTTRLRRADRRAVAPDLVHSALPAHPWPWTLGVTQDWLGRWEPLIPFATFLEEARLPAPRGRYSQEPYAHVEQLINTHPTRLFKLLIKARQTYGGTDCLPALLVFSLYEKLRDLRTEMTAVATRD